jgi:AcrR family transcriptional regulator
MTKKEQIIREATHIFNEKGFEAVSMYELSGLLGMSRGNLVYHFRDKDALLKSIVEEMWQKIEKDRSTSRQYPTFENLHNEVQLYYKYQKEYAFVFLNYQVINHPEVRQKFREMTENTIQANMATLALSLSTGNLKAEPYPGVYKNIAFTVWMLSFFWLSQQIIRGDSTTEDGEKLIWSLLLPHFTPKAIERFKAYFGEEYLTSLGEPLQLNMFEMSSF